MYGRGMYPAPSATLLLMIGRGGMGWSESGLVG